MNSLTCRTCWTIIFVMVCALGPEATMGLAQEPRAPLTKDELVDLCQARFANPTFVLNNFVRRNKIAFLPTQKMVRFLTENGCSREITNELKLNFASRLVYRVCAFEPSNGEGRAFAQLLSERLGEIKYLLTDEGRLLSDKTFDPSLADVGGMTQQELNDRPHEGFLLILGRIEAGIKPSVTARLVFMSRSQGRMEVSSPKTLAIDNDVQSVAEQIAQWSIEEVEKQIR